MWVGNYALGLPAAALTVLTVLAPLALLSIAADGLPALVVLAAGAGWGAAVLPGGWDADAGRAARLCLRTALGLGVLATLTLALGCAGWLNTASAWGMVIAGWLLGLLRMRGQRAAGESQPPNRGTPWAEVATALLLVPAIVLLLFAATLPPGLLWMSEGQGYDVREYHLQAPREYFERGRIEFLPHNVYASFPQQMEMLYLLLMHLLGGPYYAAVPAQLLHAGCAILAAVAAGAWLPAHAARRTAWLLMAGVPWMTIVGALAYVEGGLMFFAAVAGGLVIRALDGAVPARTRDLLLAGICAGLAGGCKYTALVLVAAGLGLATAVAMLAGGRPGRRGLWRGLAVFTVGASVAFAPWAMRNVAFTGNPVYPFAYGVFGGVAWSPAQDAQWRAGHSVSGGHAGLSQRIGLAAKELLGEPAPPALWRVSNFGWAVVPAGLLGMIVLARRQAPQAVLCGVWSLTLLAAWVLLTHVPGRFALPLIVPLTLAAGLAMGGGGAWSRIALAVVSALGAMGAAWQMQHLLREHDDFWQNTAEIPLTALPGDTATLRQAHLLHQLPNDAYIWLIGDAAPFYLERRHHYTVVFCRDPWLEFAQHATPRDAIAWLKAEGVTHVAVGWPEVERLRQSYGFPEWVTPTWFEALEAAGLERVPGEFAPIYAVWRVR